MGVAVGTSVGITVGVAVGTTVGEGTRVGAGAGEVGGTGSTGSGLSHATAAMARNSAIRIEVATDIQRGLVGSLMTGASSSLPKLASLLLDFWTSSRDSIPRSRKTRAARPRPSCWQTQDVRASITDDWLKVRE